MNESISNPREAQCILPWSDLRLGRTGTYACCYSLVNGILKNHHEHPSSLWDTWNSDFYKAYRTVMSKRGYGAACSGNVCDFQCSRVVGSPSHHMARTELQTKNNQAIMESFKKGEASVSHYPSLIQLFIDVKCNLACPHCNQNNMREIDRVSGNPDYHYLDVHSFDSELDEFFKYATEVFILGGEPCICRDFDYLIGKLKAADGARLSLYTNGHFMNKIIPELDVYHHITVSVDAPNAEVYAQMRPSPSGKFDFAHLEDNLRRLQEANRKRAQPVATMLSFVITGSNYMYMPEMVEFTKRMDIDRVDFAEVYDPKVFDYKWMSLKDQIKMMGHKFSLDDYKGYAERALEKAESYGLEALYLLPSLGMNR